MLLTTFKGIIENIWRYSVDDRGSGANSHFKLSVEWAHDITQHSSSNLVKFQKEGFNVNVYLVIYTMFKKLMQQNVFSQNHKTVYKETF